jgi:uncharacterized protein YbbC (DUF1343 family)
MNKIIYLFYLILLIFIHPSCESASSVETGLDRIYEYEKFFIGNRIGIVTNHTAYNSRNEHITDIFFKLPNTKVVALFGPEHGIRGNEAAGLKIEDEIDPLKIFQYIVYMEKPVNQPLKCWKISIFLFSISRT